MGKNKKKQQQKGQKKKKNIFVRLLKIVLAALLCVILFVGVKYGAMLIKYKNMAEELVSAGGEDAFTASLTTVVHDADGNEIMELNSGKSTYYLKFDEIPYMARQIFIAVEDRKFYEHSGIDYLAVGRAALALVQNKGEVTQGGSTITQQLARNIFLSHEVSAERKLKEMFIAWELEKEYTKDQILEFYINDIYFANGYYGLEAAARGYFGRSATSLTLSELAFICSIPNNPTLYDPLTNFDNTVKRRDRVLKQLYELGYITQDTYYQATSEEIQLSVDTTNDYYNYVETFVRYCATIELMRLDGFEFRYSFESDEDETLYDEKYSEKYSEWNQKLFTGGYQIYTSIDMELQEALQNALDTNLSGSQEKDEEGIYSFQGSAACIDNSTGYVCAVVGGRSQPEYEGYTLNRAYQSFRQPGSAIKPILVYGPLFERNYTPESIVKDEKTEGGPANADRTYVGDISIRDAIKLSKNTVPWQYFGEMGYRTCIRYLLNMNFTHIVKSDYTAAMSIGGMTYGVSSTEMAAAYATLANQGTYRIPTCITCIEDKSGNVIYDDSTHNATSKQIYEVNATLMLTDCMKTALAEGTGRKYNISNAICAAKTGTTNDNRDAWLVGYSKYYTTAVWCGYDMPKEMDADLSRAAGYTWQQYMEEIHEGLDMVDFEAYRVKGNANGTGEKQTTQSSTEETTNEEELENMPLEGGTVEEGVNQGAVPTEATTGSEPESGTETGIPLESGSTETSEPEGGEIVPGENVTSEPEGGEIVPTESFPAEPEGGEITPGGGINMPEEFEGGTIEY